jgi:protein involved in polysaccharide export with SLBB domain
VVAKVADYHAAVVYATGAVGSPGRYELRSNEMELAVLLAKAGGIGVSTNASGGAAGGAKIIRIRHAGQAHDAKPLEVPVRDRNIPVANVALQDSDIVEVEHYDDPLFTVTGLVMSPGVHPYPPTARYSLQQVLAMSGGIDIQAGPRYAMVYRQGGDGKMIAAEFRIGGRTMIEASDVLIKPGDIICLEHSIRTRWNKFWATVLHFGAGAYAAVPITTTNSSSR